MSPRLPPAVVLLAAPGTLETVGPALRRSGARFFRLASLEPRPVDPARWLKRIEQAPPPDTVVLTSRHAVEAGVRPWRRSVGTFPPTVEFWAAGPGTAQALRRSGIRRVRRPPTVGATAVAKALRKGARRTIVYLRSEVAGPGLARALRREGHRVVDVVVYGLAAPPPFTARERRRLDSADMLVVTSPSGLSALRSRLGREEFLRLSRNVRLVVLGERSRKAAAAHGFRHTSVVAPTTAQRFTRHLLRELRDAPR